MVAIIPSHLLAKERKRTYASRLEEINRLGRMERNIQEMVGGVRHRC